MVSNELMEHISVYHLKFTLSPESTVIQQKTSHFCRSSPVVIVDKMGHVGNTVRALKMAVECSTCQNTLRGNLIGQNASFFIFHSYFVRVMRPFLSFL